MTHITSSCVSTKTLEDTATIEVKFMNKFAQASVHVYQNYFDEIILELQSLADRNREINQSYLSLDSLLAKV